MKKPKPLTDESGEVRELLMEDIKRFRPASEALTPSLAAKLGVHRPQERRLEVNILTTDRTFVEGLNAAGIKGIQAAYRPTMAYDSAEHIYEIAIIAMESVTLKLVADWISTRWKIDRPAELIINNQIINNTDQIIGIIDDFIDKQDRS